MALSSDTRISLASTLYRQDPVFRGLVQRVLRDGTIRPEEPCLTTRDTLRAPISYLGKLWSSLAEAALYLHERQS